MEYVKETRYRINISLGKYTKDTLDVQECFCKNTSEVVDLVYNYLNKFDVEAIREISIEPETVQYYKKGTV